ncbi:lysophospholipase-like protein [Cordyceps fumosorosea ARSEF 2679]|uniref:Lysophospholipase-like protein n=1 Tax=Cordyceps fumosorosea (strain ARSEF 2679) TaxID=1081104 RepID=A0A168BB96_CORFA|nr:lysophospholipase-like protein [Cordyceps fumosorosea ARSEF 2679]OAA69877.1 lysophospholipase-like protein [Cordyceps fumosorosea ARSEF 2679]
MSTNPPTYADQQAWKDIQAFLPPRLHFTPEHSPVEEWWSHRGHDLHLDRWRNPSARTRVILHHGVGTNGRQMSMLLGVPLHAAGFDVVAIDMPGYGCTRVAPASKAYPYDEWVQIGSDFVDREAEGDARPVVLYGLSAGGMLTYHIAARNRKVKGIIGMTFLDLRLRQVADETSHDIVASRAGLPLAKLASATGLHWLRIPMSLASKMSALVNDDKALKIFLKDKSSAGSSATTRFLATYSSYEPALEPEEFDVCPILLTQPAEDRWTPEHLSNLILDRVKKVPVTKVTLANAGHYPLEDPGLQEMADAIIKFLRSLEPSAEKL